ncbi:hypothetical protein [Saccharothrix stipae]
MTALVRGLALGITPDEPEPDRYQHGDEVVVGTKSGDIDAVVVQHHDDGWVEITSPRGEVGWTVHERQVSAR